MKKDAPPSNDMLIADALVQLISIERLLISKGVFTQDELNIQMKFVMDHISKTILKNANIVGDLDEIIKSFESKKDN